MKSIKNTHNKKKLLKFPVVIIPARKGSKRLKYKNIRDVWGKPMIYWSIKAAKESKYVKDIYVTTDCQKIYKICQSFKVNVIMRPKKLARDHVYKMDAIKHAVRIILRKKIQPSIVISQQANSPELKGKVIDKTIDLLIKNKRSEVIVVDKKSMNQNGALRTMLLRTVFDRNLSTNVGVVLSNETDIHTPRDLRKVNKRGYK